MTSRWHVVGLCAALSVSVVAGCGSNDDRPSDAEWRVVWDRERQLMPSDEMIIDGGEDLCGDLIGQLRISLPELIPTPTEALDDAVRAWIAHAETIAFECPHDPTLLAERTDELAVLAAEIDAGLAADE